MAEVVNMPKLGFDMAEGTLVRWVITEGGTVEKGDVLAEIETDKATIEVESSASGIVHRHLVGEGTPVPVGGPIAIVGEAGEEIDADALVGTAAVSQQGAKAAAEGEPPRGEAATAVTAVPEAAAQAEEEAQTDGRYPDGVKASPVARRLAADRNLDLRQIRGSGPGGRIVKKDVEAAIEQGAPAPPRAEPAPAIVPAGERLETQRLPLSNLRRAIGRRMTAAKQELPHFYVTTEVDAAPMMALRKEANAALPEDEPKLSVNDFLLKACAVALRRFPNVNASLDGDAIVRHGSINIGVAVAVENGLLTVVVHDVDLKPLRVISAEARERIQRAREGKVRPDDVEGATFTVSNLGMFEVDHFIAIINPPEAAILAIGSVREVPVVEEGEIRIGQRLKVTLSADHRVTDGAEAAEWLQLFKETIEHPLRLML